MARGERFAVSFTFDFDAEEADHRRRPRERRPARRALARDLRREGRRAADARAVGRQGVTATFFIPGRVAERHPSRVEEIVAAGPRGGAPRVHAHLADDADPRRGGARADEGPRGAPLVRDRGDRLPVAGVGLHRAHEGAPAAARVHLLVELHGRLRPYRHEGTDLIELPIQWILDDAAHFWFDADSWNKKIATAEEVRSIWQRELRGYRKLGGAFILTMHPQIIGRPYRLELLEAFMDYVLGDADAWVTTCREIAARVPSTFPHVRVEGSARERGRSYGEQARDRVRRSIEAYREVFAAYAGWDWPTVIDQARAYEAPIERFDPAYLEEMRGVAEGAGVADADVLAINVRTEVMFAAKAREGGPSAARRVLRVRRHACAERRRVTR